MTMPAARDEVECALRDWSPAVREIVSLFPENLTKWGIFDTAEHPVPTYAGGRVCLAGDAAHATTPFHGAGAGMGVEDALVLATALEVAVASPAFRDGPAKGGKAKAIAAAFQAYSAVRLERSQWVVQSSRDMGDIYEWRYPATGRDPEKCKAEFEQRSRRLWDFDVEKMVGETKSETERQLKVTG
jgi:salicylate hydroxylase